MLELAAFKMDFNLSVDFSGHADVKRAVAGQLAGTLDRLFAPPPGVSPEQILHTGYRVLFSAVENNVLGLTNPFLPKESRPEATARVIAYGAKGTLGGELLPPLFDTPLRPAVLWDAAAKPAEERMGLPVMTPDFESLRAGDIVLVLPRILPVRRAVEAALRDRPGVTVLYHYQVLDYLSACHYPALHTSCALKADS